MQDSFDALFGVSDPLRQGFQKLPTAQTAQKSQ